MKNYIFSLVCLCCTLLPALEGQAHEYPNHPELRKSDANIVGHILDKNTKEHLSYITVALKGTTIGTVTDATGHYFLKNLPEGNFVLEVSSVGYKTVRRNVTLKKGRTLEEDFEIEVLLPNKSVRCRLCLRTSINRKQHLVKRTFLPYAGTWGREWS